MNVRVLISLVVCVIGIALWLNTKRPTSSHENKTIAITQIVDHPSLNQARQGLIDALNESGYKEGENLEIIYQTPHGNLSIATQIAKQYNHLQPDAIVAISTTSAQTIMAANTHHNAIVFASVTDPLTAKLIQDLKHPGLDVTGTMESPRVAELIDLARELLPQTKSIGIIYNPGEANSAKTVQRIKEATSLKIVEAPISNSLDVPQAVNAIINEVDILILPSDNTVWSALEKLVTIAKENQVPVFAYDPDSVRRGVTLALGSAQYDVGHDAGKKVVQILEGELPGNIPVTSPMKDSLYINMTMVKEIHLEIPVSLLAKADLLIEGTQIQGEKP